ncbi:GNAT family N-acetyltransferase [Ruegeria marina]|uniref:Acetyltransferase (GNAT) family protein n=1 Tax=Ruegeria marina TaxID=639004 RepID=A0A1G6JPH4_9RHOB|nr:GNAT family N-acetyltransferase [Ruegeria marina]SDC19856.1 Acetyltransferase (GNAT) family protein [Ruegeria marina]
MIEIVTPQTPDQFDAVRRLCWQYRDFLLAISPQSRVIAETFYPEAKYAAVMDRLEQEHTAPQGGVRLVLAQAVPVGCGMFHTLEPGIAEIKRVYLTEAVRGRGAGLALMIELVRACRAQGFAAIRMDTGAPLEAAQKLYDAMGFARRDPYYDPPEIARDFLRFFEMRL